MKLLEKIERGFEKHEKYAFAKKYFAKNKKESRTVILRTKEDAIAFFLECKEFSIPTVYNDRLDEINDWWNIIGRGCGHIGNHFHFSEYNLDYKFESKVLYRPSKKDLKRMREYLPVLEKKRVSKEKEYKEKAIMEAKMQKERYDNDPKNKCSKGGSHTITMKGNYFGYGWGECSKCGCRF